MSLTLKYRPLNFEDVVNQSHIIEILQAQVSQNQVNNNYLFFGPRGTGKTTIARILSRAVNCLDPQPSGPCNQCINCKTALEGKTLDLVEIDAASHTSVDNVRDEIIDKAPYPPASFKKKVYIIDEVHMLSKSAFNALLKIMEEPPAYLMFILATTEINKVPETIISRCQVFNFKKLTNNDIVGRLEYIANAEGLKYSPKAFGLIANVCDGAMRDAVKYLDQVSILGEINEDNVSRFLGVAPDKIIKDFVDTYKSQNISNIFQKLDEIHSNGIDLTNFAKEILMYIDSNLMSDLDFFLRLSDVFKNIIMNIKNYPLPLIIYKLEIYKSFGNLQELPKPNILSPNTSVSAPSVSVPQQEVAPKKEIQPSSSPDKKNQISSDSKEYDLDVVMKKAIEICENHLIKTALKNFVNIDAISGDTLKLVVINKMQYEILQKQDNVDILTDVFSRSIDSTVKIEMIYMSKEDYFAQKLG